MSSFAKSGTTEALNKITMAVPSAIACSKPDGICHNTFNDGTKSAIASYCGSLQVFKDSGFITNCRNLEKHLEKICACS